jgi:formamidopyrimidine-DNA glycosylase
LPSIEVVDALRYHKTNDQQGALCLIKEVAKFIQAKELGPDVLNDDFDFEAFRERLSGRRGMIKTRLMNQQIIAGVDNVYSDEILFQARVRPKTPVQELDEKTLHKIFDKMKQVLQTAIDNHAEPQEFPTDFLIPQRHEGGQCPNCGGEVQRIDISGRSAYYCPTCQKRA